DLIVGVERLEVVADNLAISPERLQPSGNDVVERLIVIAWNNDLGSGKCVQETAGICKFLATSALGQVARDHHDIGLGSDDRCREGRQGGAIQPAEMEV